MKKTRAPRNRTVLVLARSAGRRLAVCGVCVASIGSAPRSGAQSARPWPVHSMERPRPSRVDPGPSPPPAPVPSDAIVLFDGRDLSAWQVPDSANVPPRWKIVDGSLEVVPNGGGISTRQDFGDVQMHVEWMAPSPPRGSGQDRGNSGVFLMGRYEVQVLDSYENDTYPDGQAGAVYGQFPPLVNAARPPGEWQSYDIVFRHPRFRRDGSVASPARMSVIHNGVLVHDHVTLTGPTAHKARPPYATHADELPIVLQDHGHPVRFRNIWLRKLSPIPEAR